MYKMKFVVVLFLSLDNLSAPSTIVDGPIMLSIESLNLYLQYIYPKVKEKHSKNIW